MGHCLYFDFAENWTAVVLDQVQRTTGKKTKQVPIFARVVTTRKPTDSFAVVSDDVCHDSAHACLAIREKN